MSESLTDAVLVAATLTMGLNAGLFYTFSMCVMPGLRRADDRTFVTAMQRINAAILNGWFVVIFVGPGVLAAVAGALLLGAGGRGELRFIVGGLALYGVMLGITMGIKRPAQQPARRRGRPRPGRSSSASRAGGASRSDEFCLPRWSDYTRPTNRRGMSPMSLSNAQVRATIAVTDLGKAAAFYEQTLGLSPQGDDAMGAVRIYPCGDGSILQVYASEHAGTATSTVASWSVADFDSVVGELSAKGVRFESYGEPSTDDTGVHTFGEHKVVWFKDPDGNTIAVDNGLAPS